MLQLHFLPVAKLNCHIQTYTHSANLYRSCLSNGPKVSWARVMAPPFRALSELEADLPF